jgi:radical SAM protein with 4Fe4S-binding SPASM domain
MFTRLRQFAFRRYQKMEIKRHQLSYLFLEITRRCNLKCLHCGSDCSAAVPKAELTTASWIKLIDDIHDSFGPGVAFAVSGGEPLCHPDFDKITGHIASRKMRWGFVTNGQLLTADRMAAIMANNPSAITISLDGPQAQHDWLRNQTGAFDKTLEAMRLMATTGLKYNDVVTCVHPGNLDKLDETAEIILASGLKRWRLFRIFPSGRAGEDDKLSLSFDQTWQLLDWIKAARPRLEARGLHTRASCEGYLPFKADRAVRDMPFFCRAGVNIGAILSDGTVTGCSNNDESFYQGNVLENNFRHIWETRFEAFRDRSWVKQTSCGDCRELKHCQGGSIHLWHQGDNAPRFCYCREV